MLAICRCDTTLLYYVLYEYNGDLHCIASSQLWMFLSTNALTVAALVSGLAPCCSPSTSSPSQLPRESFSNEHYYSESRQGAAAGGGLSCVVADTLQDESQSQD